MKYSTDDEKRRPFLYKYFTRIPEQGEFVFLDGGWMRDIVGGRMSGELSDKEYRKRVDSTKRFERSLADNGYLVMKFSSISMSMSRRRDLRHFWQMTRQSGECQSMI